MSEMNKVVVTGGAGFIGSHLAEELVSRGYSVLIVDDLSSGKLENLERLREADGFQFIKASIIDLDHLRRLFQGVDYVFHLAADPSVSRSIENPLLSHETNLTGTLNVLVAARDRGIKKVIYASSCAVYGDTPTSAKSEDMVPNPQSPYAVAKIADEYYCRVFEETYGMPTVCLRYFNVYGPRQNPKSNYAAVIPSFIGRISRGNPPIIFGDGKQTRDFVFVADVVMANILAAESDAGGTFNIGCGQSITINELVGVIAKVLGKKVTMLYQETRPGDVRHSLADISKAESIGYRPRHNLEKGLKETMEAWHSV